MTLPLTRESLAAAYDYLCSTPPFNKWNLPDSDDVMFRVTRDRENAGCYTLNKTDRHRIDVSHHHNGHTLTTLMTIAHEMVHLHQIRAGMWDARRPHNAAFKKLSAQVCKYHGFDPKLF